MSHFIPPFSLGGFKPSPATLSEFIYQIWLYLQQNPIMPESEIKEEIADTIPPAVKTYIETNPELAQSIGEIVDEYLVENPPESPVQSVNNQTGDVVIDYKSLVPSNIQIPVFIHDTASTPSTATLMGLRTNGFRFTFNSETTKLSVINSNYTLTEVASGDVASVNSKTGVVVLTAADIEVDPSSGDTTLKDVADTVDELDTTVSGLSTDVSGLSTDVSGLLTDVSGLSTNVTALIGDSAVVNITNQISLSNVSDFTGASVDLGFRIGKLIFARFIFDGMPQGWQNVSVTLPNKTVFAAAFYPVIGRQAEMGRIATVFYEPTLTEYYSNLTLYMTNTVTQSKILVMALIGS